MKTALELLGLTEAQATDNFTRNELELVAERAREEMRAECHRVACESDLDGAWAIADAIGELPTKAKP
jgi:hypothetical protein